MHRKLLFIALLLIVCPAWTADTEAADGRLTLTLLRRVRGPGGGVVPERKTVTWDADETAAIVCDVWNDHWCKSATRRTRELAPRVSRVVKALRRKGVLIIHAPSGTMDAYANHPARRRARQAPEAPNLPEGIDRGGRPLDREDRSEWPIEVDNGCPEDCEVRRAWTGQIDTIEIRNRDAISDSGREMWNLMEERDIENVLFMGVHTNMCVLNRPFGLRNLVRYGKNAVLVRDLTDTMYDPAKPPHVSHFRGTDLVVDYIERYVCPTVLSSDIVDAEPFRFPRDNRQTVLLAIAEREYHTWETLPSWANRVLANRHDFRLTEVYGWPQEDRHFIPGFAEHVRRADLVVLSVRRRALPAEALQAFRSYLESGKPMVGVRTASHAFNVRGGDGPEGHAEWPEFDAEVLGCNYHGHFGSGQGTMTLNAVPENADHPVLGGIKTPFKSRATLYRSSPLEAGVTLLLRGEISGEPPEPVAWVNRYGVARVFYTSLGDPTDFEGDDPPIERLLTNAVFWGLEREPDWR